MLTLKLSWNDSCKWIPDLLTTLSKDYPTLTVESFNEDSMKERKKAFGLKNTWGTRMSPFVVLYDENKPIKAFYSEDDSCTFDQIVSSLNSFIVY